jgi:hypothetical protein
VAQAEVGGVEREAAARGAEAAGGLAAVLAVAEDRAAEAGQVQPDLVGAPGLELEAQLAGAAAGQGGATDDAGEGALAADRAIDRGQLGGRAPTTSAT